MLITLIDIQRVLCVFLILNIAFLLLKTCNKTIDSILISFDLIEMSVGDF